MKRKMTLVAAVLTVVILVSFMLIGCKTTTTATTAAAGTTTVAAETTAVAETTAAATAKKVILSNAFYTAPYCAVYDPSALAKAKELGIDLQILDGEANQQKQLEQAKLAVTTADGFLYFPADVEGSIPVIEALKGFPYIIVNAYTLEALKANNVPYYVGPKVEQHGYNMVDLMFKLFPDKKANLVAIEGAAGAAQTILMNKAFDEKFAGTEIKWLGKQNADWDSDKALAIMNDFLTKFGDKIDGIVCHDGGSAAGAIAALKAAGIDPGKMPIICAGSNKSIYEGLKAGYVYGTSTQDPGTEGALGVETMNKLLNGEKIDAVTYIPMDIATKDNMDNFNWF
ncbi:MAG: sugar ABC transporter substrate-binding protein [Candidatus Humimicrobiaceae bacterium]